MNRTAFLLIMAAALAAQTLDETVAPLASVVEREYFDAPLGRKVAASLRESLADGKYSKAESAHALARLLTEDLYAGTGDKHLAVGVVRPPSSSSGSRTREDSARETNAGVQRAEVLPGNIGYLNLTSFEREEYAASQIAAAMAMLRNTSSLILDLRGNGGGSPGTVALLASYFFEEPGMALFEIVPRSGIAGTPYRTQPAGLADRNASRPLYILTSAKTFSAGEGFAFLMQERGRARVLGETTAGAANPGRPHRLNETFEVTVPNGRVRSSFKGGNWEGRGVVPDVACEASKALEAAIQLAVHRLP